MLSVALPQRNIEPYARRISYKVDFAVKDASPHRAVYSDLLHKLVTANASKENAFTLDLAAAFVAGSDLERFVDDDLARGLEQTIVIIQPGKDMGMRYCYSYSRGASCSQNWLTKRGVLVVDLGAGPVSHGSLARAEMEDPEPMAHMLLGRIVNLVTSAVEHVFLPDVAWGGVLQVAQRTIVAVLVLQKDSIEMPAVDVLNQQRIRRSVGRIVEAHGKGPGGKRQSEVLFRAVDIHQHKAIATVLAGARREESFIGENLKLQTVEYLDSTWILDRLIDASQSVLVGLLAGKVGVQMAQRLVSRAVHAASHGEKMLDILGDNVQAEVADRIIPVFIIREGNGLLLDFDSRVVATSRHAVLVAHPLSGLEDKSSPYFISAGTSFEKVSPVDEHITRHVVAGLGVTLGGLVPPYADRHSADWRFAHGHHPFGPFTQFFGFNDAMLEVVRRNLVLSRLDVTIQVCDQALRKVGALAESEVYDPHVLRALVLAKDKEEGLEVFTSWLHVLYEFPSVVEWTIPTVRRVVVELYQLTIDMAHSLQEVQADLEQGEMELAEEVALDLLEQVITFHLRVDGALDDTLRHLSCCNAA